MLYIVVFSIICVINLVFLHVCVWKSLFSQRECSSLIRIGVRLKVLYYNYKWLGTLLRHTDPRRKKGCDARMAW